MRPYRVSEAFEKGYYTLKEINKAKLKSTYTRNYLKKFVYIKSTFQLIQEFNSEDSSTDSSNKSEL